MVSRVCLGRFSSCIFQAGGVECEDLKWNDCKDPLYKVDYEPASGDDGWKVCPGGELEWGFLYCRLLRKGYAMLSRVFKVRLEQPVEIREARVPDTDYSSSIFKFRKFLTLRKTFSF